MKYNEIINMFLWKQLPYEIKCLLFSAISGHYIRRNAIRHLNVIKDISTIGALGSSIRSEIKNFLDGNQNERVRWTTDERDLLKSLDFLYWHDDCLSYTYFIKNIQEDMIIKEKRSRESGPFKIHFNSTEIRDIYGDSVYLYYLDNNDNWIRFNYPLPYGSFCPIPHHLIEQYKNILISHLNFLDDTIHPLSIKEAIDNPIFKFLIDELHNNYFSFNGDNPRFHKYFVKKKLDYKGFCYKTLGYKHIFNNKWLVNASDIIRYNYLYNKLVFKEDSLLHTNMTYYKYPSTK